MKGLVRFIAVNLFMGASLLYMVEVNKLVYLLMIFAYLLIDLALVAWIERINKYNRF